MLAAGRAPGSSCEGLRRSGCGQQRLKVASAARMMGERRDHGDATQPVVAFVSIAMPKAWWVRAVEEASVHCRHEEVPQLLGRLVTERKGRVDQSVSQRPCSVSGLTNLP